MSNGPPLNRLCVRIYADDHEYLRKIDKINGDRGVNFQIRQIVHLYVMGQRDANQRRLEQANAELGQIDSELFKELADEVQSSQPKPLNVTVEIEL